MLWSAIPAWIFSFILAFLVNVYALPLILLLTYITVYLSPKGLNMRRVLQSDQVYICPMCDEATVEAMKEESSKPFFFYRNFFYNGDYTVISGDNGSIAISQYT